MPFIVDTEDGVRGLDEVVLRERFDYSYPEGMDLHPTSDLHKTLVNQIMKRARESAQEMKKSYSSWNRLDDSLRLFARPDWRHQVSGSTEAQISRSRQLRRKGKEDSGMPYIIMPTSMAALETLLVFMTTAFTSGAMFPYEGKGPEDVYGAILLELIVQQQAEENGVFLNLHTMWRDAFVYGFGAASPIWKRNIGNKVVLKDTGFFSQVKAAFIKTGQEKEIIQGVISEGCALENIDPYAYFPDPDAPLHDPSEAEYISWVTPIPFNKLLRDEKTQDSDIFNTKYLRNAYLKSTLTTDGGQRSAHERSRSGKPKQTRVDVLWMYWDLIPAHIKGMGSSKDPETWLFAVGADKILLAAHKFDQNTKPVVVAAPGFDGHSLVPMSRMESISALQQLIDFLYTSHIQNVRKALNDMFVVDPQLVNIFDLADPRPGKLIRTRRSQWGRGNVDAGIKQLEVRDVTAANVSEAFQIQELARSTVGANSLMQGDLPSGGPRINSQMSGQATRASLSTMEYLAKLLNTQAMRPMGQMFGNYVQQFMDSEEVLAATGETIQRMARTNPEVAKQLAAGGLTVSPAELIVDFKPGSSLQDIPGSQDPALLIQLFQMASQSGNPELLQGLDLVGFFVHIAKQMGAKNIDDFLRINAAPPTVLPDGEVESEVQAGNLIPVGSNGQST